MLTGAVSELIREVSDRVVVPRFGALGRGDVEHKSPGDVVTIADREAEAELTRALMLDDPGALVVGEEAAFDDPALVAGLADAEHAWVIDPVDGTRNFAHGSPHFGVMIAELRRGTTVRSWIWQPINRVLYVAERGGGVTRNGVPLAPFTSDDEPPYTVAVYAASKQVPHGRLSWRHTLGSCAIDYPRLLAGTVDALGYRSIHPWDHLPGALMVTELGGFAGRDAAPYAAGVSGRVLVVARSRALHDEVDAALRA